MSKLCAGTCVSFPKSGRTWLRRMLEAAGHDRAIRFTHDGCEFCDGRRPAHDFDREQRLSRYPVDAKVLYLERDPRDVMVSLFHQITGRCGDLFEYNGSLTATDVHPHGYGDVLDFLDPSAGRLRGEFDWIVTNPPFENGGQFIELGLKRARVGVALLCRLQFIEGAERYPLFMRKPALSLLAPFAERVPMQLGSWDPQLASATAYAWFIWDKRVTWSGSRIEIIPPGTRNRLWRADDVRRFAPLAPAPLLEQA